MHAAATRETKARVRSALYAAGVELTRTVRVSLQLPPGADGVSALDLAIAAATFGASTGQSLERLRPCLVVGELDLYGGVRPTRGAVAHGLLVRDSTKLVCLVGHEGVSRQAATLALSVECPTTRSLLDFTRGTPLSLAAAVTPRASQDDQLSLDDIQGQEPAKAALVEAARTGTPLLLVGPPGAGKTMLAVRYPGLLPDLTPMESEETSAIWSVTGLLPAGEPLITRPPLRAPHYTASDAGIEVSLAHNGVLLLDELPEFRRSVLDQLLRVLEQGEAKIARSGYQVALPARFRLIATMNPCPCGWNGADGASGLKCSCTARQVERYLARAPKIPGMVTVRVPSIPVRPRGGEEPRGEGNVTPSRRPRAALRRFDSGAA